MKKFLLPAAFVAGVTSFASAAVCPEANFDSCTGEAYSIVETEAIEYWPHNQMEAAHRFHFDTSHKTYRHYRVHRFHVCR